MTAERDPRMAPFEALIGTWTTESRHPLFDGVVTGTATFEWLAGGHFLVWRSHQEHESFPDGLAVMGPTEAGDGLRLEYFDSRGVRRTYEATVQDGVWRWWRDHPGFDQRAAATLGPGEFELVTELAEQPGEWREDLVTIYRRA